MSLSQRSFRDSPFASQYSYLTYSINTTLNKSRKILDESRKLTQFHHHRKFFLNSHTSLFPDHTDRIGQGSLFKTFDSAIDDPLSSKREKYSSINIQDNYPSYDNRTFSTLGESPSLSDTRSLQRIVAELRQENLNLKRELQYSKSITEDFEKLKGLYNNLYESKNQIEQKLEEGLISNRSTGNLEEKYKEIEEKYLYEMRVNERLRDEIRDINRKENGEIEAEDCLKKINTVEDKLRESFKSCEDLKEKIGISNKTCLRPKRKTSKSSKSLIKPNTKNVSIKTGGKVAKSAKLIKTLKRKTNAK
ncbi:unnamed protein product [Blepharisma stoltei]|uniref:Uncharacterized protein n=1 Tax=Blepharisma stoltei TaxID=1481888 RepID=A0AAU9I999_9CILI|nr:unnamed protein product [Blepharisma stoltei]